MSGPLDQSLGLCPDTIFNPCFCAQVTDSMSRSGSVTKLAFCWCRARLFEVGEM